MKFSSRFTATLALLSSFVSTGVLGAEYRVGVGKDETTGRKGLGFDPSVIHPIVGDVIAFEFRSGAHSAVQSTFEHPCTPNGGFNSGVITVANDLSVDAPGLPIRTLTVNSTDPLWFFDEAGGLCSQGAVLAVNPTAAQPAHLFKENASRAPPVESTSHSDGASASTPSPVPSGVQEDETEADKDSGVRHSAAIAGVVGTFFGFVSML